MKPLNKVGLLLFIVGILEGYSHTPNNLAAVLLITIGTLLFLFERTEK